MLSEQIRSFGDPAAAVAVAEGAGAGAARAPAERADNTTERVNFMIGKKRGYDSMISKSEVKVGSKIYFRR